MTGDKGLVGRPRDETAGPALKAAARRLVIQHGYEKVSISDLIRDAGVSRQSLYRRWPTKAALVLEAFFEAAPSPDLDPSLDARSALCALLEAIFDHLRRDGAAIRSLIASAQNDPQFRDTFRRVFVVPREALIFSLLQQAQAEGELPADADLTLLCDTLHGAFWYRLLNDKPLDAAFARGLTAIVTPGSPG